MHHATTQQQIGIGNLMACGAREFVGGPTSLVFRVGSKRSLVEKVIVTLDPSDTYSVRYVAMRPRTFEVLTDETRADVYADQLGAVVRKMGDR